MCPPFPLRAGGHKALTYIHVPVKRALVTVVLDGSDLA